jgi:hypothetical protein
MRTRDFRVRTVVICALVALTPLAAAAQEPPAPPTPQSQGPMTVEVQRSGAVIAPDVKLTEVDGDFGTLVGAYAGWLNDGRWFIGGAGYWLANGAHDRGMAYGGLVVQWLTGTNRRVTFGAKGLVGGGQARLASTVTYPGHGLDWDHRPPFGTQPTTVTARVVYDQDFFIAEPQVDLIVNVTPTIRFGVGGGYRIIGAAGSWDRRLRGATGSVSLQIGGS